MSSNPEKLLPHPSFVYCAKFHNRVQKIVVTGSYDSLVRVWNLQTDSGNAQVTMYKRIIIQKSVRLTQC